MIRSAVIGGGKISEEHLRFLAGAPGVGIAAVCDLSPTIAEFAARSFDGERTFTDYREMLAEVRPDVVHILTPPATHLRIATDSLEAGAHVLIEKPVALCREEFHELWDLAESKGRLLIEDQNYRFNRPVEEVRSLLRGGALGELAEVEVRMALGIRGEGGRYADANLPHPSHRLPAGVIHEFLSHLSYLMLDFLGVPDEVHPLWNNHEGDELFKYDDLDALLVRGPVHGRMRFTCRAGPDCFVILVRGKKGWAEAELFQPMVRIVRERPSVEKFTGMVNHVANGIRFLKAGVGNFTGKILQRTAYEGLEVLLERSYRAVRGEGPPPITFEDMDETSALIDRLVAGQVRS